MTIHYQLDFSRHNLHFVDVKATFIAANDNLVLWLPTWIAGSYLIREFAKHLSAVHYKTRQGDWQRAKKVSKNAWQLAIKHGDTVSVCYSVYCFDRSIRSAYIDSERIFVNFSSLLLNTTPSMACDITLIVPKQFIQKNNKTLACALPFNEDTDQSMVHYRFSGGQDVSVFDSYDYPLTIAHHQYTTFTVQNKTTIKHHAYFSGRFDSDLDKLGKNLQTICQAYHDWLGVSPFDEYTFMTHATKNDYGGLEHINSTALITPRDDLDNRGDGKPSPAYLRFLGLCSHEYFHAWWVKSVRPDVMMTSDLQSEAYTPLLWVFEGFTSYIDDLMLYKSGIIGQEQYQRLVGEQLVRYLNTDGVAHQSLAESSFDAWIKFYRPDENSPNSTVSYYNKGMVVSLLLDLLLIEHGIRLFDVIKHFCDQIPQRADKKVAMGEALLDETMALFLPKARWDDFKRQYIDGVNALPLTAYFKKHSISIDIQYKDEPFGLVVEKTAKGLAIKQVSNDGAATQGLSVGDVIVAIDGLFAETLAGHKNDTLSFLILRQDELLHFDIDNKASHPKRVDKVVLSGLPTP